MRLFLHQLQDRFREIKPKKVWYISYTKYVRFITFLWAEKTKALSPKAKSSLSKSTCCFCCLETYLYELSKKETSPHIQLLLFPANFWTCVNICITLRHKLNMFHRHLTNTNGIKCPETKEGSISKISCVHQLLWALQFLALSLIAHDLPVLAVRCFSTLPASSQAHL